MTWQSDVRDFHRATGSTIGDEPFLQDRELRALLIAEEAAETVAALGFDVALDVHRKDGSQIAGYAREGRADLVETIDGICDLIYVALGTAVASGVEIEPFWREVHRSNMDKVTNGYKDETGKWRKPSDWQPPDIAGILEQQAFAA